MTTIRELPEVISRDQWLARRMELLAKEKALTKAYDDLNAERRRLPMVKIEKDYVFEGPGGEVRLIDLFEGRQQLIIYHYMFGPSWDKGCMSCAALVDESSEGRLKHLHNRDTTMAMVSRAPLDKITRFKASFGWTIPWYSSFNSDFNYDFHVTLDESVAPVVYDYKTREEHEKAGTSYYFTGEGPFELPGFSCFLRDGATVFHTYSTYGRGGEAAITAYHLLDLTVLGRQEEWEEPQGRVEDPYPPNPNFAARPSKS
ncbi:MAG TPA: DUF899 domain-containing protein [Blastocatellia bacterium]